MTDIVLYERDDLMYGLLREWLSAAGYSIAAGRAPAVAGAPVQLVIVSVSMPKQENEGQIQVIRHLHPQAAIIALTSQARSGLSSDGAAAAALGVQRVMAKPLTRSQLLAAVEAMIGPPKLPS